MNYPKEVWDFIAQNKTQNINTLALKLSKKKDWPTDFILAQVNGIQKGKKKFPSLVEKIIFPPARALEQASSEETAFYKASLMEGTSLWDLSGGMGIDSFAFSKCFENVSYVEQNERLVSLAKENFNRLEAENIQCIHKKAEDFLSQATTKADWIYLDPDRREQSKRLVSIEDCSPNVLEIQELLLKKSSRLMTKLSPMLDIQQALRDLPHTYEVIIVSVKNECKELLFLMNHEIHQNPLIKTVHLRTNKIDAFSFHLQEESETLVEYSEPLQFLYEPNASIMKSGGFHTLAKQFGLFKLAPNTHLYTSEKKQPDFPGRIIAIEKVEKPAKGFIKAANVVVRNYPLKPEEIRKKFKIAESKDVFCYACTLANKKRVFAIGTRAID